MSTHRTHPKTALIALLTLVMGMAFVASASAQDRLVPLRLDGPTQAQHLWQASTIHASQKLTGEAVIRYHAEETIVLTAGFSVAPGASFEAMVIPAQPPAARSAAAGLPPATEIAAITLYPHPADACGILEVHLPQAGHSHITVYDLAMQRVAVLDDQVREAGTFTIEVRTENWPAGTYVLHVRHAAGSEAQKLVVQH